MGLDPFKAGRDAKLGFDPFKGGRDAKLGFDPFKGGRDAKSDLVPTIWRVTHAERGSGTKSERAVRICCAFHPSARGELGLTEVATAQRGRITHRQLRELGFSSRSIEGRIERGLLHRRFRGVFAVGHAAPVPLAEETAALLYAGDNCLLSHECAAALWAIAPPADTIVLTAAGRELRSRPGLRVHRVAALHPRDVRLHHGLPVTAPARTLIDFAARARRDELERALNEARVLKLVTDASLAEALDRARLRSGAARLRALMRSQDLPGFTRAESERRLAKILRDAELRPTCLNTIVEGCEVDALFAPERIVVEVDGFGPHGTRAAFERDRRRDQILAAAGYTVIRTTWRQLFEEPLAFVARLAQALARAADRER